MASIQHPYKAPPGTAIRPDGTPVGSVSSGSMMWLGVLVAVGVGVAFALNRGASREPQGETVVAPSLAPEPVPEPAAVVAPDVVPEAPRDPLADSGDANDDPPPVDDAPDRRDGLDSDDIKAGVAAVKAKIFACGDRYPDAQGTFKVRCKVNRSGRISEAKLVDAPDAKLGACIVKELRKARFPKSGRESSFTYPFNF